MCQRVSADLGTGVGSTSAVGARRRNSVICRRDKASAIELLVPAIWVTMQMEAIRVAATHPRDNE